MKLLLIDAYAMIYRAYYAFIKAPRMNSKGQNTSAVFGFVVTLEDLIKRIKPTHLAVAFDPHGATFRHEAYEQYKAQRPETPEDIRAAVPIIQDILKAMNIPAIEAPGFEADDVIGTLAGKAENAGFEVFMATPDKDYGQLVTDRVHMYRPRHTGGFEQMGPAEVCAKYGLQDKLQVIDLLGLMGDASDNIPGCKGVGEKTAVQLLTTFGSIENLLAHTDELKGALKDKIESQVDNIRFSKFLATIRTDVPLDFNENDFLIKEKNWSALESIYRDLEFNSLLKSFPSPHSSTPHSLTPHSSTPHSLTPHSLTPHSLTPHSTTPHSSTHSLTSNKPQKVEATLDLFASASEDALQPTTCHLPPTTCHLQPATCNLQPEHDTPENRLCQYLLNPEVAFNPYKEPNWDALKADADLWKLYNEVELPLEPVLRRMEQSGVRFDLDMLSRAQAQLTDELTAIENHIYELAGKTFNINSPRQVGEVLFDDLRLDNKAKKSKNGQYSTSEEVLQALKEKHPIVGQILDQRELKKLISTYIAALPSYINPETGKIHTTYNQTVTATGRLSSSNPNLQNLPIRSERGQLIRQAVIPDEGCLFLSADYSQIELRIMAHMSQDPHLLEAFRQGQDIHAATAAKIFGVPIDEVTKDQRRRAKTANFGILYGISAFGLSQQLDCSRTEAKALIDDYFTAFPKVIDFIEQQKLFAREHGYVQTLFGRKRYLPDINSQNGTVRSFAERNAVNSPIQGTAADIIKKAMVAIASNLSTVALASSKLSPAMIMQVHDELNFNVPADMVDEVKQMVVDEMQHVVTLSVPLIAECGVGKNWLEAH